MMPKVLMVEYQPWDFPIQNGGHKYARQFLKAGWSVFWLTAPLTPYRFFSHRERDRAYIKGWRTGVISPLKNLRVYTPFSILPFVDFPLLRNRFVAANALKMTCPSLKNILDTTGFDEIDVIWMNLSRAYSILEMVRSKLLVYRMFDDIESFPREPALSSRLEAEICSQADIVFATAQNLVKKAQLWSDNVHYLPNGVDFDFFAALNLTCPPDLAKIPQPRILYVGAIDTWLDFKALTVAATRLSSYSFVIIGPVTGQSVKRKLMDLGDFPNVYVMGSRPFVEVRHYMRHASVGIIPFVSNRLTHCISPIKLFEYLATGLPVVSRRLNEIEHIASTALLYDSHAEFVEVLKYAVSSGSSMRKEAIQFAKANSWESRYKVAERIIHEKLSGLGQGHVS